MKTETYLTAEQLGTTARIRTAIINAKRKLSEEAYSCFNMMNVTCCAVAYVGVEYGLLGDDDAGDDFARWCSTDAIIGIYGASFVSASVNRIRDAYDVRQQDAAWVWHHYLTTGRCPESQEYAARIAAVELCDA